MAETDRDFETLLEDVKTIKAILQNEDAELPRVWLIIWTVAPVVFSLGLLQYFVPFFRSLDFDGKVLWLWLPAAALVLPVGLVLLYREIARTGKGFLVQSRIRNLLYARFVVPPAALVLAWLASRNPGFSLEGTLLVIISIWITIVEQAAPERFRPMPFVFLGAGLVELGFGLSGPEVTLFNIVLVASTMAFVGLLFFESDRAKRDKGH